jgi:hypothetical protein
MPVRARRHPVPPRDRLSPGRAEGATRKYVARHPSSGRDTLLVRPRLRAPRARSQRSAIWRRVRRRAIIEEPGCPLSAALAHKRPSESRERLEPSRVCAVIECARLQVWLYRFEGSPTISEQRVSPRILIGPGLITIRLRAPEASVCRHYRTGSAAPADAFVKRREQRWV